MSHPRHSLLERYVLGELNANECLALEEHVEACPTCAAQLAEERAVNDLVVQTSAEALPAGTSRRMFDDLWASVDADEELRVPVAPPNVWRNVRRAAAVLVLGGAATWWALSLAKTEPFARTESGVGIEPTPEHIVDAEPAHETITPTNDPPKLLEPEPLPIAQPEAPALSSWEQRLAAALENPGARTAPAWTSDEQATSAQLTSIRARVATMLIAADAEHPDEDEAFLVACHDSLAELRSEGWAVEQLVRGVLLRGDDEAAASVALRSVLADTSVEMTLARAVADDRWVDEIVAGLRENPRDLSAASPLGRALSRRLDDSQRFADMVELLSVSGGTAWIEDVLDERVVAAIRRPSEERSVAAFELARVAPTAAGVEAWVDLAKATGDARAARGFASTLADHREATVAALAREMNDPRRRELAVEWIFEHALKELAPQLVSLASERGDAEIAAALPGLSDARATRELFDAWREHRGRPLDEALVESLTVLLIDHPESRALLARAGAVDDIVDVLDQAFSVASSDRRTALRDACADVLVDVAVTPGLEASRQARVLASLARQGSEQHGRSLLTATPTALSWITAALLAPDASSDAFASAGGDPRVLAAALDELGAWPAPSVAPSSRALRGVERELSRFAAAPTNSSLSNKSQGDDE